MTGAPPPFPAFPSEPTGERGRTYQVHRKVRLFAFHLPESELPPGFPAAPVYLFTFLEKRRVGYWNWTTDPEDLRLAMETMRAGLDPSAPRPSGDYTIRPQFNRDLAYRLHQDAMATEAERLDVSLELEEQPEAEPDVIPLRPDR